MKLLSSANLVKLENPSHIAIYKNQFPDTISYSKCSTNKS